jgi:hypothetical protein
MRVASIKPDELALVDGEELVLIREILAQKGFLSQQASMIDFIAQYDSLKNILGSVVSTAKRVGLDAALLKPPVERPSKIWAAAFNYKRGTSDIKDARARRRAGFPRYRMQADRARRRQRHRAQDEPGLYAHDGILPSLGYRRGGQEGGLAADPSRRLYLRHDHGRT